MSGTAFGLTVIANAPNPAGQSPLNRFFRDGISPAYLFLGALFPTLLMAFAFSCSADSTQLLKLFFEAVVS